MRKYGITKKRRKISKAKRRAIWIKHIGDHIFKTKCVCCGVKDIDPFDFQCGHVEAHSKGGSDSISNLIPICSICNIDMGSENMKIFMKNEFKRGLYGVLGELNNLNNRLKKISNSVFI